MSTHRWDLNEVLQRQKHNILHDDTTQNCSVCLSSLQNIIFEEITLPCSHSFHTVCFRSWLQKKSDCPLCRYKLEGVCLIAYLTYINVYIFNESNQREIDAICNQLNQYPPPNWLDLLFYLPLMTTTITICSLVRKFRSCCRRMR